jgi:hypothetical protein
MELGLCRCALRTGAGRVVSPLLAAVCVLMLAGCGPNGQPGIVGEQPRGATVAFESIDGPPPEQFKKLVHDLNDEAQSRHLAVVSRDKPSVYRVRGYLSADITKHHTKVSWVWDVFDKNEHRALRITGTETAKSRPRGWPAASDEMLKRIANSSMDQLATFLTSPEVTPNAPVATAPQSKPVAFLGWHDVTPEAAGIFRIFRPQVTDEPAEPSATGTAEVPLPRNRPATSAAVSARETVTLSALRARVAR